MPRRVPKRAEPGFLLDPDLLEPPKQPLISDQTAQALGKLLCKPIDQTLREAVQECVLVALQGEKSLDHSPTSKDYIAEFKRTRHAADELLKIIRGWTGYYREAAREHGIDSIAAVEEAVDRIAFTAHSVIAEHEEELRGKSSKSGAPPRLALATSAGLLKQLFDSQYAGPKKGKAGRRDSFILDALTAAGVVHLNYSGLPALLRRNRTKGNLI